jgi:hypothetical protein
MSWSYRVLYFPPTEKQPVGSYGVHEVYYNEQGDPVSWTANPITFTTDEDEDSPLESLKRSLRMALSDAELPVLRVNGDESLSFHTETE